jgi:hypothetical protein
MRARGAAIPGTGRDSTPGFRAFIYVIRSVAIECGLRLCSSPIFNVSAPKAPNLQRVSVGDGEARSPPQSQIVSAAKARQTAAEARRVPLGRNLATTRALGRASTRQCRVDRALLERLGREEQQTGYNIHDALHALHVMRIVSGRNWRVLLYHPHAGLHELSLILDLRRTKYRGLSVRFEVAELPLVAVLTRTSSARAPMSTALIHSPSSPPPRALVEPACPPPSHGRRRAA